MAKKDKKNKPTPENMPMIHPHAAGIDVGAEEHWVCVPTDRVPSLSRNVARLPVTCIVSPTG